MPNDIVPLARSASPTVLALAAANILESWLDSYPDGTRRNYIQHLADFASFLKVPGRVEAVETLLEGGPWAANQIAQAYKTAMRARGLAPATIAVRLATIRSMVKRARTIGRVEWALDVKDPKVTQLRDTAGPGLDGWKKLATKSRKLAEASETVRGRPSPDQSKRDLALIRLMHDLGLRRGECVSLDLVHLSDGAEDEGKLLVKRKGKDEKERLSLTVPAPTMRVLRDWIAVRGSEPGPLFIRMDPGAVGLERLTGDSVWRLVKRLSRLAGLKKDVRPHGIRHQAISRSLDLNNGNVRETQKFSGHAKIDTVQRYDDARHDVAGAIARKLAEDK